MVSRKPVLLRIIATYRRRARGAEKSLIQMHRTYMRQQHEIRTLRHANAVLTKTCADQDDRLTRLSAHLAGEDFATTGGFGPWEDDK